MKKIIFTFFIIMLCNTHVINAQQTYGNQRGQRGYISPTQQNPGIFNEIKDPHEEANIILSKCVEAFKLDAFEKEILKSSLIKRIKGQNAILGNEDSKPDVKKKKLLNLDKEFYKELSTIFTKEEIEQYQEMDFSETKEEKKQKKKKKKQRRKEEKRRKKDKTL